MRGLRPHRSRVIAALLAAGFSAACGKTDGEPTCRPGSLQFSRPASKIVESAEAIWDFRIAAALGSSFAVVWASGPERWENDLRAIRVNLDGSPASNEVRVTLAAGQSQPVRLAAGPGGIGAAWSDGRLVRRVGMASVLSPETLLPSLPHAILQAPVVADDQLPIPAIAPLGDGFGVFWNGRGADEHDHLFVQRLAADGTLVEAPVALVPDQSDRAGTPSAASVGSGGVIVVDEEVRVGAPDADVFAYFTAGSSALAEARYGTLSRALAPEAVGLASPGVLWKDRRESGDRSDLYYAPIGVGERRLTTGPETHVEPRVAAADDFFFVQWIAIDGDRSEVRVRAHKPDGRPDGPTLVGGEGSVGDVAWNAGFGAAVWMGSDGDLWFRPIACQSGARLGGEPPE